MTYAAKALRLVAAVMLLTALAACGIISKTPLIGESEAVPALGDSFTVLFYKETPAGYAKDTDGEPMTFTLMGTSYMAADGSAEVRFAPRGPNRYIVSIRMEEGYVYGAAWLGDNHVLEMHVGLRGDPRERVRAALAYDAPELAEAMSFTDTSVEVRSRAALEFMIGMIEDGEVGDTPMIGYITSSATDPFPGTITHVDHNWVVSG